MVLDRSSCRAVNYSNQAWFEAVKWLADWLAGEDRAGRMEAVTFWSNQAISWSLPGGRPTHSASPQRET